MNARENLETYVPRPLLKAVTAVVLAVAFAGSGYVGGVWLPQFTGLSWLTTVALTYFAIGGAFAGWAYWRAPFDVASVAIQGQITRRSESPFDDAAGAESIAEEIDDINDDGHAGDALLVELNTPGGEILPSEEIRRAVDEFDGPTVAYVQDICASGGYLIASACDKIVVNESSMVGSIGVIGSQINLSSLADRLGVSYEQFTSGEFKDAGHPVAEMDDAEREYIQRLIDGHYDTFVERVASGRDLSEATVRGTEARVFRGSEAVDIGLADVIGTRETAMEYIATELHGEDDTEDVDLEVNEIGGPSPAPFSPTAAAERCAYAFGSALADRVTTDETSLLNRLR